MPSTYTPIATQTLVSSASTVTFSSISGVYTDLILIMTMGTGTTEDILLRFNSDTGSNYSRTYLYGDGTSAASGRNSNVAFAYFGGQNSSIPVAHTANFMNYSNTTTNKTAIVRTNNASAATVATVHLWRSTAAISTISLFTLSGNNLNAGSTFTLYGVKSA